MSPEEKVAAALQRSITYLPAEMGDALRSFLEPEALAIMAGTMAVWAASHLLGVGELVDVLLLLVGFAMIGKSVFDVAGLLWDFGTTTLGATTDAEIDEGAQLFARAVILVGLDIVMAILLHRDLKTVRAQLKTFKLQRPNLPTVPHPPNPEPGASFYKPKITRTMALPSNVYGSTEWWGDIAVSRSASLESQRIALFHEWVHSVLSPKFVRFRMIRMRLAKAGYFRIAFLKYLEEALAQSYGLLKAKGLGAAFAGIAFPVKNGYVTISALLNEGAYVGTVIVGGLLFRVHFTKVRPSQLGSP